MSNDGYLRAVPSDTNPNDGRLYDALPAAASVSATLPAISGAASAIASVLGVSVATFPAITAAGAAKALAGAAASATLPALTAAGLAIAPAVGIPSASLPAITASSTAHAETREIQGERLGPWPDYASPFSIARKRGAPPIPTAPADVIKPDVITLPDHSDEKRFPPVGRSSSTHDAAIRGDARAERLANAAIAAFRLAHSIARARERASRAPFPSPAQISNARLQASIASTAPRRRSAAASTLPVPAVPARQEPAKTTITTEAENRTAQAAIERLIEESKPSMLPKPMPATVGAETLEGLEGDADEERQMFMMMVAAAELTWRR